MDYCWHLNHHERPGFIQVIHRVNETLRAHEVMINNIIVIVLEKILAFA